MLVFIALAVAVLAGGTRAMGKHPASHVPVPTGAVSIRSPLGLNGTVIAAGPGDVDDDELVRVPGKDRFEEVVIGTLVEQVSMTWDGSGTSSSLRQFKVIVDGAQGRQRQVPVAVHHVVPVLTLDPKSRRLCEKPSIFPRLY